MKPYTTTPSTLLHNSSRLVEMLRTAVVIAKKGTVDAGGTAILTSEAPTPSWVLHNGHAMSYFMQKSGVAHFIVTLRSQDTSKCSLVLVSG